MFGRGRYRRTGVGARIARPWPVGEFVRGVVGAAPYREVTIPGGAKGSDDALKGWRGLSAGTAGLGAEIEGNDCGDHDHHIIG